MDRSHEPITLDMLIAELEAIRAQYGGSLPVVAADFVSIMSPVVVVEEPDIEEDGKGPSFYVIIADSQGWDDLCSESEDD